jgi:hypothetical protein
MAAHGLERVLRERGMISITTGQGRRFVREELSSGNVDDCEVIAGEGPWAHVPAVPSQEDQTDESLEAATVARSQE